MAKVSSVEQGCPTCRTVLGFRSKPKLRQKSEPTTEAKSVEPLQKDVDNLLVTVSFSLGEETTQQIYSNPNPEDSLQCDGQTATCRSESVDVVSRSET